MLIESPKKQFPLILHIDMDAFFASVERVINPGLAGKPVGVIGSAERTVIATCSYEARNFGIKTGMSKYEALKLCPSLILVTGNKNKYIHTSTRIMEILWDYTSMLEAYSIDEAFLDLTSFPGRFKSVLDVGLDIKKRISKALGLSCSVGIAPNKLLAKLASEMAKPGGLVELKKEEISDILETLPVEKLWGIGKKTGKHLKKLGILTCGQLGRYPVKILKKHFGIFGEDLQRLGKGIDNRPVIPMGSEEEAKSIGHSMTLKKDIYLRTEAYPYLLLLSEMVGRRARKGLYTGKTVRLTIRYHDFFTFSKQLTINRFINKDREIYQVAKGIYDSLKIQKKIRLFGIALCNLTLRSQQLPLFPEDRRAIKLTEVMDKINNRYGENVLTYGSILSHIF
ncbi:MAG: DNA polymerase IV [Thermodesulfobacteriota bacterium]|nr:DNA polymerase IV [Thermodesulfobacteriota bacterium]